MKKIEICFTYLEETLIVGGLAFMTVMNFLNVVSRYLFTNSFSFTEEITVMTFVWVTMLGVAAGFRKYAHLGMNYFVELMPRKMQAGMALFSMACSLAMVIFMISVSVEMVESQLALNAKTPALGLPLCMQGLAMPVGGIFISIRAFQAGLGLFHTLRRVRPDNAAAEGVV